MSAADGRDGVVDAGPVFVEHGELRFARGREPVVLARRPGLGLAPLVVHEILADLEQAIADQCTQRLRPHQQVVTLEELQPALDHVGRVETPDVGAAAAPEAPASAGAAAPLKLEQISQGAWISGVCLGLARYSGLDPTLVRALAVVLLFITGGGMILLYAVMMLMIPFAPLDASLPAPGTLPTKCREATLYLRAKFATLTTG